MLNIEDLKVGGAVVNIESGKEYKVLRVNLNNNRLLLSDGHFILCRNFKYFKKKEQSQQYTFDDLIDVAVQAKKDGLVEEVNLLINCIEIVMPKRSKTARFFTGSNVDRGVIAERIEFIQSLYKETFVIECEDDVEKIKASKCIDSVKLTNDVILNSDDLSVILPHYQAKFLLMLLKGATVEQERGRND